MKVRIDCHVHLDPIRGNARPSTQPPPTPREFSDYVKKCNIKLVWGIFERDEAIESFSQICPILPLFWIRNPLNPPRISKLARGIKLHPYRDGWKVSSEILTELLQELPPSFIVLIHCDDRSPNTIDLARPSLIAPLAALFPDLTFIIGHSGSYAPHPELQHHATRVPEHVTALLVQEAIEVAISHPNVYLDTSILVSPVKARLLADKGPHDKLLIGTDFPIGYFSGITSYDREEDTLRNLGVSIDQVKLNAIILSESTGLTFS